MSSPQPGPSKFQNLDSDEASDNLELNENYNRKRKKHMMDNDDREMEFEDYLNIGLDYIESDDNEMMFEEEDSESDEELESKELDELFENIEDTGKWTCDGDFKQFSFEEKAGLQNPAKGPDPYNFFELLVNNDFFSIIVDETNKYAESERGNRVKMLNVEEFRKFVGLLLHMGTIKCSQIQNYWSTHRLFNFNCFSQHMSRNRFQEILRSLNFASNDESSNCLSKIQPVIDYFNDKMKTIYYPHKELCINKTTVPWTDPLAFQQYIAGKKRKYGVKLYVLTESSGITLRIKMYTGHGDDDSRKGHVTKAVLCLLEDFLQKGHSVFMDNCYVSFMLSEHLLDYKTYCTGILQKFRKGNSKEVIRAKLSKGEAILRYKNKIMMGMFRDKRDILFISSEFKPNLIEVENKRKEKLRKPLVLHKYNKVMNGINRKDQMLSHYTCSRRTFQSHIKLWINIVETLLLNSFFLYAKYSSVPQKLNFYDFRLNIIDTLLFENNQENTLVILPDLEHTPEILSRGKNNKIRRKRCRQCFMHNIRKETNYFCGACEGNPGLCIGKCFKEYHRRK
ncbi:hypothetical protein KPH14_007557 [Odynerus spinipes]|uniref:PiggyBac transposable element-derived protein domain-containing protein n=1 Tax=Odynerus spinipes TaxID=1348599 RepID=A0AAD9RIU3_9HYME|nr:hypothetical protein KPH14_007557 [Odynerus spinipes]